MLQCPQYQSVVMAVSVFCLFSRKEWCIDHFKISQILGKGAFGCVYLAKEHGNNMDVAIKIHFKKTNPER